MFPELRPILMEAFELAPEDAEHVVSGNYLKSSNTKLGWKNCKLTRTHFDRVIKRAAPAFGRGVSMLLTGLS
ncbi:MAG: hypothetical protein U1D30_10905 [Planctomycetota bacterium]